MELVHFTHRDGKVESLRPTHALLVAEKLGTEVKENEGTLTARAGTLAEAARIVRDGYRCRTVRKELRRVGLIGVEGVADNSPITISCADADVLKQMMEASARA